MNKRFTRKYIVHLVKNCRPWDRELGDTISSSSSSSNEVHPSVRLSIIELVYTLE
jgi:hypothetical protein